MHSARRAPENNLPDTGNNMMSGLAKGAVTTTGGFLGDMEGLGRGARGLVTGGLDGLIEGLEEETWMPNSESVRTRLESMGWKPGQGGKLGEAVGELAFDPLWATGRVVGPLRAALRARLAKRAKAAPVELTPQELAPGFFEGGRVPELEDMLDDAYMNMKFGD
jgi:hypothetical protein